MFRSDVYLHGALLAAVAALSYWGEGAAFLILYMGLLTLAAVLILIVHGAAFLRARFTGRGTRLPSRAPGSFLPWGATRWLLRGLLAVLGAAVVSGLVVGVVARFSEPIWSFPGGKLSARSE